MATPGSPWKGTRQQIEKAIKDHKGKLTYAARSLGIGYNCLRKRIDPDPELTQLVSDLRNDFESTILDVAEDAVIEAIKRQDNDPNNALKSAFFVLNSRGQARGWNNTLTINDKIPSEYDLQNKDMIIKALEAKIKEQDDILNKSKTEQELS